jgi:hypothetical protein
MPKVKGQVHDKTNQLGLEGPERRDAMNDIIFKGENEPARPMIVVTDRDGNRWLCDENIDPEKNLKEQGCWQCGDEKFAFTRDD